MLVFYESLQLNYLLLNHSVFLMAIEKNGCNELRMAFILGAYFWKLIKET